jgi:enterochelin esterase-like enzyme
MRIRKLLPIMVGVLFIFTNACSESPEEVAEEGLIYLPSPTSTVKNLPGSFIDVSPTTTSVPINATNLEMESSSSIQSLPTASEDINSSQVLPKTATPTPTTKLAPTPTPCLSTGYIKTDYFDSLLAGRIDYRIYLPPCYSDSGRTYPVLYMLPGNIHTDSIWDELGLDEALETGIQEKRFPPMLVVMVSGGSLANNTSGGPNSYESFFIDEFVPYIEATYCALPRGRARAIGGMSRGGYWALEIAFSHADEFASVGGHSAALVDFNGGPAINPLDTGLNNDLDDLRIYFDIGENDWLLPNIQKLHEEMLSVGREHSWSLNEGMHEETYWATHVIDYLEWYSEPWQNPDIIYPPCRAVGVVYSSSD